MPVGPLGTNCYILSGDNETAAVIDPGADYRRIDTVLTGNGLRPAAVLLTHGHFDHQGAAKAFQDAGVKIYMNRADESYIHKAPHFIKPAIFKPDVYPEDGGILEIAGLKIEVIFTPGHTPGGVCFYTGGLLMSGDTLFYRDVGTTELEGGDFEALQNSILTRLYTLPGDTRVYPGHGEETTIGEEMRLNHYVRAGR